MKKKGRIAFCFAGQARTLDQTYLFFQKNLFDAAKEQGFDYDVFCAVEDDEDVDKVRLLNPTIVEKIKSDDVAIMINKRYGKLINEDLPGNVLLDFDVVRFLQQVYKVGKTIGLASDDFCLVFKLRFDSFFFNKIDFDQLRNAVQDENTIICNYPSPTWSHILGFNMEKLWEIGDFYFVGTFNAVKNLQTLFNSFEGAIEVFKVKKGKIFFKILYSLINFIKALNKKIGYWIFPVLPLFMLVSKIAKPFNPEICYYLFFLDTGLKVKKVRLSQILIRKDIQKSLVLFVPKSEFEK